MAMNVGCNEEIFATCDVGNILKMIIHNHRQMIRYTDIFPRKDRITVQRSIQVDYPEAEITECKFAMYSFRLIRIEAPCMLCPGGDTIMRFLRGEHTASAGIDRRVLSMRCGKHGLDILARAKTGIDETHCSQSFQSSIIGSAPFALEKNFPIPSQAQPFQILLNAMVKLWLHPSAVDVFLPQQKAPARVPRHIVCYLRRKHVSKVDITRGTGGEAGCDHCESLKTHSLRVRGDVFQNRVREETQAGFPILRREGVNLGEKALREGDVDPFGFAEKQPGRSGTVTPLSESASWWIMMGYLIFLGGHGQPACLKTLRIVPCGRIRSSGRADPARLALIKNAGAVMPERE